MARYGRKHSILISDTIEILRDQVQRDMFDGAEAPTRIKVASISGQIDELTEEVTYFTAHSWNNVSGIVHTISEDDILLGIGGKVKVGDTSVLYHYNAVSGIFLNHPLTEIELLIPGISGVYAVAGHKVGEIAGQPIFLKVALTLDRNV